jgi:hypothetical protein
MSRRCFNPEESISKLREAEALLAKGATVAGARSFWRLREIPAPEGAENACNWICMRKEEGHCVEYWIEEESCTESINPSNPLVRLA